MIERTEHELFKSLVFFSESKTCVEIGVATGNTTIELSKAISLNNGMVYGFDCWERHGLINQFKSPHNMTKELVEERIKSCGCENVVLTQINTRLEFKRFEQILDELCPNGIDFVFIDGCHSYQGVANDFCAIYPRLTKAGIITFHDTLICDGSREFMIDLRTKYNDGSFDIVDFYGGRQKKRRVGISMLIKRSFPITDDPILEICGSPNAPSEIERKEVEWYNEKIKDKISSHHLILKDEKYINTIKKEPSEKNNRKKFEV